MAAGCYAAHSLIYFDERGFARACCQNGAHPYGDVRTQTIREIWDGAATAALRRALERDDYSLGCDLCGWQLAEGNSSVVFARQYDHLGPTPPAPKWPKKLEFALSNACNLQCVMCDGDHSSAIRAHREGRPAMEMPYGERFFEELAEFLPHVEEVNFVGGEPLLGAEPLRVLGMIADLPERPSTTIITNGTICTPRVERLLTTLRPRIVVSIDGATPDTYAGIRVGADLPTVLANVDRFIEILGRDRVSLTFCLMVDNVHEFADMCRLAEDRGVNLAVNVVRFPEPFSLYQLDPRDLEPLVEHLERQSPSLTGTRATVWEGHRRALRRHLDLAARGDDVIPRREGVTVTALGSGEEEEGEPPGSRWPWLPFPEQRTVSDGTTVPGSTDPVTEITIDRAGVVSVLEDPEGIVAGLDGAGVEAAYERLQTWFPGADAWDLVRRRRPEDDDRFWLWLGDVAPLRPAMIGTSVRDDEGELIGMHLQIRTSTRDVGRPFELPDPAASPVSGPR